MKYIFLVVGLGLMVVSALRMFGVFSSIITEDKQFLGILLAGILVCGIGFLIESYQIKPINIYQQDRRKKMITTCYTWVIMCAGLLLLLVVKM